MKINGATAVIKTLEELKVKNIFDYPGLCRSESVV